MKNGDIDDGNIPSTLAMNLLESSDNMASGAVVISNCHITIACSSLTQSRIC